MIDHIPLAVIDLERSRRFYDAALAPLGDRADAVRRPDCVLRAGRAG
jgi:catechol 2,3-dioxygenase-like lactoylglutathione lyase family enzyme